MFYIFEFFKPTLIFRSSRRKKEERRLAVEVEFVPATPTNPPHHLSSSSQQKQKQRSNGIGQKESQAVPKVDLVDDLVSTENEVLLSTFDIILIISPERFS